MAYMITYYGYSVLTEHRSRYISYRMKVKLSRVFVPSLS